MNDSNNEILLDMFPFLLHDWLHAEYQPCTYYMYSKSLDFDLLREYGCTDPGTSILTLILTITMNYQMMGMTLYKGLGHHSWSWKP